MIDKKAVQEELAKLYASSGELKPSEVVEAASDPTSPLHLCFEWDDSAAAHEHRLWQARRLIRLTLVVSNDGKEEPYVHVPVASCRQAGGEGAYHPMSFVVSKPDLYERALLELTGKVDAAASSARALIRCAEEAGQEGSIPRIRLAISALQSAQEAIEAIH
jgi:hypothetical protein